MANQDLFIWRIMICLFGESRFVYMASRCVYYANQGLFIWRIKICLYDEQRFVYMRIKICSQANQYSFYLFTFKIIKPSTSQIIAKLSVSSLDCRKSIEPQQYQTTFEPLRILILTFKFSEQLRILSDYNFSGALKFDDNRETVPTLSFQLNIPWCYFKKNVN